MILFLTSSPTGDLDGKYKCEGFDNRNGFADEVRKVWKDNARVLMVTAFPDNYHISEDMKQFFSGAITKSGLNCSEFVLWDDRVFQDEKLYAKEALQGFDVIVLGGGHVPTQQKFFEKLHLRESMQDFDGIVIGISAGTMNSAEVVYAQPEEEGEAVDPTYQRFIPGLGLTRLNILPHYQMVKDNYLDGLHLFREISIPDSMGKRFLAIPDGSYVVQTDHMEVHGESYLIADGVMEPFAANGEVKELEES